MDNDKQNPTNITANTASTDTTGTAVSPGTDTPNPSVSPATPVADSSVTPEDNSAKDTSNPTMLKPDGSTGTAVNSDTLKSGIDQALAGIANTSASNPASDDIITKIAENIIKEQESIIGPVALEQATKVEGLSIDLATNKITIQGDKKAVLERLVKQYELLFGRISIEICKEAVRNILPQAPKDQVPQILL